MPEKLSFSGKPEEEKKKIVLADVSHAAVAEARDAAEVSLTEDKENASGGWFKRLIKNTWKHGVAREFYRQRAIKKAAGKIQESGDLYAARGDENVTDTATREAIIQQFSDVSTKELVHEKTGEIRETADEGLRKQIFHVIQNFAKESHSSEDERKGSEHNLRENVLQILRASRPDVLDKGVMFADNVVEMANHIKASGAHERGIEALDEEYEIVIGRARTGARTETTESTVDKALGWLQKSKGGSLVANEAVVAGAAYAGAALLSQRLTGTVASWASFGAAAVAAGSFAAARESKRFKEERALHERQRATGEEINAKEGSRREEMERFAHNMESSNVLTEAIESAVAAGNADQIEATLMRAESRIRISDQKRIDLISYSHFSRVAQERLALDITRAKAKTELRKLGKDPDAPESTLSEKIEDEEKRLLGGVDERNALFNKARSKRAWRAFGISTAAGLTIGAGAQEAYAAVSETEGIADALRGAAPESGRATPLRGLADYIAGSGSVAEEIPNAVPLKEVQIGSTHFVQLPENFELSQNGSEYELKGPEGKVFTVAFNDANGDLTPASLQTLEEAGMRGSTVSHEIQGTRTAELSAREYAASRDDMVDVERAGWKNEYQLRLNGGDEENGAKIVLGKDGKPAYEFFVTDMKGTKLSGMLADRNMRLHLSLSGALDRAFPFNFVEKDGSIFAYVPADSEAGRALFEEKTINGETRGVFQGKFAEVVEYTVDQKKGTQQWVWATDTGADKRDTILAQVPTTTTYHTTAFSDMPIRPAPERNLEIDPPWFVPIVPRRPLESTKKTGETIEQSGASVEQQPVKLIPVSDAFFGDSGTPQREEPYYAGPGLQEFSRLPRPDFQAAWRQHKEALPPQYNAWLEAIAAQLNIPQGSRAVVLALNADSREVHSNLQSNNDIRPREYQIFVVNPQGIVKGVRRFEVGDGGSDAKTIDLSAASSEDQPAQLPQLVFDAAAGKAAEAGADPVVVITDGGTPDTNLDGLATQQSEGNVDAVVGSAEVNTQNPLEAAGILLFQNLSRDLGRKNGMATSPRRFPTSWKASAYANFGGFRNDLPFAEANLDLLRRVRGARGRVAYSPDLVSRVPPDTAWSAVEKGLDPFNSWREASGRFRESIQGVQFKTVDNQIDLNDGETKATFIAALQEAVNGAVVPALQGNRARRDQLGSVLRRMGLQHTFDASGNIAITGAEGLIRRLER